MFDTSDPRLYLFAALAIVALLFVFHWTSSARATAGDGSGRGGTRGKPSLFELAVGFGTNFFDTLGIGSFAPTTSLFKLAKTVPDDEIPGTMMTGHTPPVIIQAFIFMAIIIVDPVTLFTLIAAAVLGAWLGAGVVTRLPRHWIQIGMGIALLIAAGTFLRSIFGTDPVGGLATGLAGADLLIAAICLCVLGALMTIGIGMYAPTMIVVSMMGMTPAVAFPIMMGSAAFLMAVAGIRFARGPLRAEGGAGAGHRGHPGRAHRGVHRAIAAAGRDALACCGGGAVRRRGDAPVGGAGTAQGELTQPASHSSVPGWKAFHANQKAM